MDNLSPSQIKEIVRGLNIPKYRQDQILNTMIIDAPYPIPYLPAGMQVGLIALMAVSPTR